MVKDLDAYEYLKENSDLFDKSPGGEKLYFESEVIRMMNDFAKTYGTGLLTEGSGAVGEKGGAVNKGSDETKTN